MRYSLAIGLATPALLVHASPALLWKQDSSSVSPTVSATVGTPVPSPPPLKKPAGGIGFNTTPDYHFKSDFDFQSFYLGLHQELIELDLFHHGLAIFSAENFTDAGLNAENMFLLEFMADQEVGHATLFENMLGRSYPSSFQIFKQSLLNINYTVNLSAPCTYAYPDFASVRDFIDFSRLITRFGESGTIGFLGHLDAQDSASLINDAIQTEGRQQMIFRQWEGLFPMPVCIHCRCNEHVIYNSTSSGLRLQLRKACNGRSYHHLLQRALPTRHVSSGRPSPR
jgi:hypothetical protein